MSTQPAPTAGATASLGLNYHIYEAEVADGLGSVKDVPTALLQI